MDRARPLPQANGTNTHFVPRGPDSIMYHLGRHAEAIDRLTTQITSLEQKLDGRSPRERLPPIPWREVGRGIWGLLLLVALVLVATGQISSRELMTILGRG